MNSEIKAYLSLSFGIILPVAYAVGIKFQVNPIYLLILVAIIAALGFYLGIRGWANATLPQKIISILGTTINIIILLASIVFIYSTSCGCILGPNAQLF